MAAFRVPGPIGIPADVAALRKGPDDPSLEPRTDDAVPPSAEEAVLRRLGGTGEISYQSRSFRIIRTDQWRDFPPRDRYEVVARDEAEKILDGIAQLVGLSKEIKAALGEVAPLIPDTRRARVDGGLLLLRRKQMGVSRSTASAQVLTPSQARKLTTPVKEKTFIAIRLVTDERVAKPVPFARYRIELPDRSPREGILDADGYAMVDGIDPGTCKVSFPDFHKDEWKHA